MKEKREGRRRKMEGRNENEGHEWKKKEKNEGRRRKRRMKEKEEGGERWKE